MDYTIFNFHFTNPPKHWNPDAEEHDGAYADD